MQHIEQPDRHNLFGKPSRRFSKFLCCLVPAVIFTSPSSHAQDSFNFIDAFNQAVDLVQSGLDVIWPGALDPDAFSFRGGLAIGTTPDYVGSDNYRIRALPVIDLRYKNKWRISGSKLLVNAITRDRWAIGPLANLKFGRDEGTNRALMGLGDINTTLEVGAFVQYKTKYNQIMAEYRYALGEGQGSSAQITVSQGLLKNGKFSMAAAARLKWMSDKAMQTNFGVTRLQARRSDAQFNAFNANSGFSDLSVAVIGDYQLHKNIHLAGLVQFGRLMGDAGRSPIVNAGVGNRFQVTSGIGLLFQF